VALYWAGLKKSMFI